MRRVFSVLGLILCSSVLLVPAGGCGDDDDGPACREQCGPKKPYCGPNGECVECEFHSDCAPGQTCGKDYECHG